MHHLYWNILCLFVCLYLSQRTIYVYLPLLSLFLMVCCVCFSSLRFAARLRLDLLLYKYVDLLWNHLTSPLHSSTTEHSDFPSTSVVTESLLSSASFPCCCFHWSSASLRNPSMVLVGYFVANLSVWTSTRLKPIQMTTKGHISRIAPRALGSYQYDRICPLDRRSCVPCW
jgi:hypothetical protein